MTISYEDLPFELKQFVRDGEPFPDIRSFTAEAILSAKQLRKQYFRDMQIVEPGSQYHYVDFERVMRNEIHTFVKRVLQPKILNAWDEMLDACNRVKLIWESLLERNQRRLSAAPNRKRERIMLDLKRECIRRSSLDGRTLGQMELFVKGQIFYGSPPGHNWNT
tara:strand:- start:6812 stop:7303 length:492 start_codon:yes stop_codon:yes gene_type:complete